MEKGIEPSLAIFVTRKNILRQKIWKCSGQWSGEHKRYHCEYILKYVMLFAILNLNVKPLTKI